MDNGEATMVGPDDDVLRDAIDAANDRRRSDFRSGLRELINSTCREGGSDTPDFILASYLEQCLDAFDCAVAQRTKWYGPK